MEIREIESQKLLIQSELTSKSKDFIFNQNSLTETKKTLKRLYSLYNDTLQTVQTALLHIQQLKLQQQLATNSATNNDENVIISIANTDTLAEQLHNLLFNLNSLDSAIPKKCERKSATTASTRCLCHYFLSTINWNICSCCWYHHHTPHTDIT